jgi:hypothetical protein
MKFKGPAARALDAWYSAGNVTNNLTEAQTLLRSGRGFTNLIRDLKAGQHGKPEFEQYPMSGSVLQGPGFEREARDRYLDAIGVAFGHNPPVPIRTTWEAGAGNTVVQFALTDRGDHVEVTISLPQGDIAPAQEQQLRLSHVQRY